MKKLVVLAICALAGVAHAEDPQAEKTPIADHDKAAAHGSSHYSPHHHFRFFGSPFGHGDKDAFGGKLGDGEMIDPATGQPVLDSHGNKVEEPMSAPFIFLVLNFVLLVWLVAKFGGRAGKKLAAERHDQIKTALDEAAKLRTQAQDKLAEYETKLKAADSEITKLVEGMRTDAEADKKRILENAERQAAQLKREAEQRIAAEIETARAALMREVSAAATGAAEKLLREKMTSADQNKVIATFIADVQSATKDTTRSGPEKAR
jgi:F0F1-type ATP synthase membrane subunit b/b'